MEMRSGGAGRELASRNHGIDAMDDAAPPESPAGVHAPASISGPMAEEVSQAKARLGVCLFALAYMAVWAFFSGAVSRAIVWTVGGYTAFSAFWFALVRLRPGEFAWRRISVIVGDLGINTFFMHALQAKGAFFYPLYLWIIVGNGVRYGPRYLMLAMAVGVAYFGPMLFWSPYWKANAVAGSGLLAGLVVLPVFYLALIRNLHLANARLSREVERSQAAVRAKTEFLANMSHELRTPMNGVIGIAELMRATSLTDTQQEYLRLIQRSAGSLLQIIDDILELSRIEAGKINLSPVALDLAEIVDDVYHLLQPGAREKKLEIRVVHPAKSQRAFVGDSTRIRQILINLVGNAVKFTERGHIDIAYSASPRPDGRAGVSFRIADTGVGIPRDKLDQVFGKFERAESPGRKAGGSGLGLAISRLLARMMEGDLTVSSELGQGSVFTVTMVLEPTDEPPATAPRATDAAWSNYSMRALVVEDHPVNRLVIRGYLETLGLSVVSVEDGRSALQRVREQSFDLVIMDVRLPVMDGLEATRRIREEEGEGQHLPIVALTANAFAEDREACLRAGMDLHLRKPMQLEDLRDAIEILGERGLLEL